MREQPAKRDRPAPAATSDPVYDVFGAHIFTIMSVIAQRLACSASPYFRKNFGMGLIEWRIIYALGYESPLSSQQLSIHTDFDKAAISRSLRVLAQLGWIEIVRTGRSQPRKLISITPLGRRMRDEVVSISLARQDRILSQISEDKIEAFRSVLKFLMDKTSELDKYYGLQQERAGDPHSAISPGEPTPRRTRRARSTSAKPTQP